MKYHTFAILFGASNILCIEHIAKYAHAQPAVSDAILMFLFAAHKTVVETAITAAVENNHHIYKHLPAKLPIHAISIYIVNRVCRELNQMEASTHQYTITIYFSASSAWQFELPISFWYLNDSWREWTAAHWWTTDHLLSIEYWSNSMLRTIWSTESNVSIAKRWTDLILILKNKKITKTCQQISNPLLIQCELMQCLWAVATHIYFLCSWRSIHCKFVMRECFTARNWGARK